MSRAALLAWESIGYGFGLAGMVSLVMLAAAFMDKL